MAGEGLHDQKLSSLVKNAVIARIMVLVNLKQFALLIYVVQAWFLSLLAPTIDWKVPQKVLTSLYASENQFQPNESPTSHTVLTSHSISSLWRMIPNSRSLTGNMISRCNTLETNHSSRVARREKSFFVTAISWFSTALTSSHIGLY